MALGWSIRPPFRLVPAVISPKVKQLEGEATRSPACIAFAVWYLYTRATLPFPCSCIWDRQCLILHVCRVTDSIGL